MGMGRGEREGMGAGGEGMGRGCRWVIGNGRVCVERGQGGNTGDGEGRGVEWHRLQGTVIVQSGRREGRKSSNWVGSSGGGRGQEWFGVGEREQEGFRVGGEGTGVVQSWWQR
jgi:hypothetical protein